MTRAQAAEQPLSLTSGPRDKVSNPLRDCNAGTAAQWLAEQPEIALVAGTAAVYTCAIQLEALQPVGQVEVTGLAA